MRGQVAAVRALEVVAAGGHNLLLTGPPGTGKSMLAARLPGLLPPLSAEDSLEVTRISSVAGLQPAGLIRRPPFQAPHHSITAAALIGGGRRPGVITRAHAGVLFLDEVSEFPQHLLDLLRQPIESGSITIQRQNYSQLLPARFQLVAARNPCPCGNRGVPGRSCRCSHSQIQAYARRLSGPLLDRIDVKVEVPLLPAEELPDLPAAESSSVVRARVFRARQLAVARQGVVNAALSGRLFSRNCVLDESGKDFMAATLKGLNISARGYHRLLRVTRTIADLDSAELLGERHLAEAVGYLADGSNYPGI